MKKYRILHPLILSFFSRSLYRDVGRNWKGIGGLYLLLLSALLWIPTTVKVHVWVQDFLSEDGQEIIEQIPPVTITDGKVTTPVEQPYVIVIPTDDETKEPELLAVIDTTGVISSLDDTPARMLLTSTHLHVQENEYQTKSHDLRQVASFHFDKDRAGRWARMAGMFLIPCAYISGVGFLFAFRLIQILLFGLIGLIFSAILRTRLEYGALLRLSAVAITPGIVLNTAVDLAGLSLGPWWPALIVIALVYLFVGVKACGAPAERPSQEMPPVQPPSALR
ncbi:MAG: DUF1189 family protein [Planctomycetota bacterium]|jgi:hypothetical protein